MEQIVLSVYDSAVGQYLQPFFTRSKAEAIRMFGSAANQSEHDFHRYASDYVLFALGEFNPQDGTFEQYPAPERLAVALELIEREPPDPRQMSIVADDKHADTA